MPATGLAGPERPQPGQAGPGSLEHVSSPPQGTKAAGQHRPGLVLPAPRLPEASSSPEVFLSQNLRMAEDQEKEVCPHCRHLGP